MPRGGARPGAGRKKKDRSGEILTTAGWLKDQSARGLVPMAPPSLPGQGSVPPGSDAGPPGVDAGPVPTRDPVEFMLDVMQGKVQATSAQMQAAVAAAPYIHPKKGETGKKGAAAEKAAATAGRPRFAPAAPPRLVHSK